MGLANDHRPGPYEIASGRVSYASTNSTSPRSRRVCDPLSHWLDNRIRFYCSKCNTFRTTLLGIWGNRRLAKQSSRKRSPGSMPVTFHILDSSRCTNCTLGVHLTLHGSHLIKGKQRPRRQGSCMLVGQCFEPTGTVVIKSIAL